MSERLLEDFAQIASDWFWEMDADLRFSYLSDRAAEFGISRDHVLGRTRLECAVNQDNAAFWQPHLDDLEARRPYRDFTYPYRRADGALRWIRATGQPRLAEDGTFLGYRGVGTDVTAEREMQERLGEALAELQGANELLERQNLRFGAALNNMAQGLLMLDRDRRMIVCNTRCIEIMGLSAAEMRPGVTLFEIIQHRIAAGLHRGYTAEEVYAERREILLKGEPAVLKTTYDDEQTIEVAYRPMPDGGWVMTYDDVTERESHLRVLQRQEEELRVQNLRFDAALNNMAQGLAMFDAELRVIVCNSRYPEMMGLPPEAVRPGVTLRSIVERRVAAGRHPGCTADEIFAARKAIFDRGEPASLKTRYDGSRTIQATYHPMADGGWVLTYEDVTERERHLDTLERQENELRVQNLRFDAALNNMAQGLAMFDSEQRLIVCNGRYLDLFGMSPDVVKPGVSLRTILEERVASGRHPGRSAADVFASRLEVFAKGEPAVLKTQYDDGRTIQATYRPMLDGAWVLTYEDITERELHLHTLHCQEEELRNQNLRFDAALNNMSHGLCLFDEDRRLIVCNRRYAEMYRLPPELATPGTRYDDILEHRIKEGLFPRSGPDGFVAELMAALEHAVPTSTVVELQDDRILCIAYQPMPKGGWLSVHEDVTERKRAEARIEHMARHDALTDLANRTLFRDETERALLRVNRRGRFAVLCLDLDHFKAVNDTLGHPAGDAVLCEVTERLRACVREGDTVARLGGDEFAVLQVEIERPEEASGLARRIIEAVSEPYDLDGQEIVIGASIGIAIGPGDGTDPDQVLKHADMALYRAKSDGRGTFRFFEKEMDARLQARRALELDLRKALSHGEFELFYQPLVDLRSNQVSGCEALLRWHHPERGLVSPADFIPMAEEIGLIVPLGEWVLREACREAAKWPKPIKVAVNLSPAQFKSRNLVPSVIRALASSGLSATRLELEITENLLLLENESTLATLHHLRGLGVRISMDDFGTGYSSLSYLRSFPFDKIKIDRSFVRDLAERPDAAAIIRAVAGLGLTLGMTTTAEGVETMEQLEQVRAEGCTEVQGYLVSRPRRAADLASLFVAIESGPLKTRSAA